MLPVKGKWPSIWALLARRSQLETTTGSTVVTCAVVTSHNQSGSSNRLGYAVQCGWQLYWMHPSLWLAPANRPARCQVRQADDLGARKPPRSGKATMSSRKVSSCSSRKVTSCSRKVTSCSSRKVTSLSSRHCHSWPLVQVHLLGTQVEQQSSSRLGNQLLLLP